MSITHAEDFEGVGNAVAVDTGNTSFAQVTTTGSATCAGSTTTPIHDAVSALITPASGTVNLQWGAWSGVLRLYVELDTVPTNNSWYSQARVGGSNKAEIRRLSSSGAIQIRNGSTAVATSTATFNSAGDRFRLEWQIDATAQALRIFHGANVEGSTPDETISGAATAASGFPSNVFIGAPVASNGAWRIDSVALADDWVGPVDAGGDTGEGSGTVGITLGMAATASKSAGAVAGLSVGLATADDAVKAGASAGGSALELDVTTADSKAATTTADLSLGVALLAAALGTSVGEVAAALGIDIDADAAAAKATSSAATLAVAFGLSGTADAQAAPGGIVDLHFVALTPELVHGPALSPALVDRVALSPELAHGTPGEPVTAARSVGEPELGHADADDPELAHGQPEAALTHGATGTPTV